MKNFKHFGVKRRFFPENNYNAFWYNLKTTRFGEGVASELEPDKAEFYDVGIGTQCNAGCDFCFPSNTQIATKDGSKNIENIVKGDFVYTINKNGNLELNEVTQIFEREYDGELYTFEFEDGSKLTCTPNHKIYINGLGYVSAEDISTSFDAFIF